MTRPFHMFEIDRYGDTARVQVFRVEWLANSGSDFNRTRVADYETSSRGATASARREIQKIEATQ